jgi:hypothetical protein
VPISNAIRNVLRLSVIIAPPIKTTD